MTTTVRTALPKSVTARDYGPVQAAQRLGIARWQFRDAMRYGLIPAAQGGRWAAGVIEDVAWRLPEILYAIEQPGTFFIDEDGNVADAQYGAPGEDTSSIVDLVFGQVRGGEEVFAFPSQIDLDSELHLTSPVLPPLYPDLPRDVEDARRTLQSGPVDLSRCGPPMADEVELLQLNVREGLYRYLAHTWQGDDRLYVLEFQGPWQYSMFGHTKHLATRVTKHMHEATRHGFALLNAWASPSFEDAREAERSILLFARHLHGFSRNESFPHLPYPKALSLVRAVFEQHTGWAEQAVPAASAVTYPDQDSAELARILRHARGLGPGQVNSST